jgi:hypothetical protein
MNNEIRQKVINDFKVEQELKKQQKIEKFEAEEFTAKLKHLLIKKLDTYNKQKDFYKLIDINNIKEILVRNSKWMYCMGQTDNSIIITYKNNNQIEHKIDAKLMEFLYIFNHTQSFYRDNNNIYIVINYFN